MIQEACKEKIERDRKRGILNRPVRAMVVGIPNVGKSTFINALAGKACAKTGNKPGVTKGKQWIRLNKNVELLDTPESLGNLRIRRSVCGWRGSDRSRMKSSTRKNWQAELTGFLVNSYPDVLKEKYEIKESADGFENLRGSRARADIVL